MRSLSPWFFHSYTCSYVTFLNNSTHADPLIYRYLIAFEKRFPEALFFPQWKKSRAEWLRFVIAADTAKKLALAMLVLERGLKPWTQCNAFTTENSKTTTAATTSLQAQSSDFVCDISLRKGGSRKTKRKTFHYEDDNGNVDGLEDEDEDEDFDADEGEAIGDYSQNRRFGKKDHYNPLASKEMYAEFTWHRPHGVVIAHRPQPAADLYPPPTSGAPGPYLPGGRPDMRFKANQTFYLSLGINPEDALFGDPSVGMEEAEEVNAGGGGGASEDDAEEDADAAAAAAAVADANADGDAGNGTGTTEAGAADAVADGDVVMTDSGGGSGAGVGAASVGDGVVAYARTAEPPPPPFVCYSPTCDGSAIGELCYSAACIANRAEFWQMQAPSNTTIAAAVPTQRHSSRLDSIFAQIVVHRDKIRCMASIREDQKRVAMKVQAEVEVAKNRVDDVLEAQRKLADAQIPSVYFGSGVCPSTACRCAAVDAEDAAALGASDCYLVTCARFRGVSKPIEMDENMDVDIDEIEETQDATTSSAAVAAADKETTPTATTTATATVKGHEVFLVEPAGPSNGLSGAYWNKPGDEGNVVDAAMDSADGDDADDAGDGDRSGSTISANEGENVGICASSACRSGVGVCYLVGCTRNDGSGSVQPGGNTPGKADPRGPGEHCQKQKYCTRGFKHRGRCNTALRPERATVEKPVVEKKKVGVKDPLTGKRTVICKVCKVTGHMAKTCKDPRAVAYNQRAVESSPKAKVVAKVVAKAAATDGTRKSLRASKAVNLYNVADFKTGSRAEQKMAAFPPSMEVQPCETYSMESVEKRLAAQPDMFSLLKLPADQVRVLARKAGHAKVPGFIYRMAGTIPTYRSLWREEAATIETVPKLMLMLGILDVSVRWDAWDQHKQRYVNQKGTGGYMEIKLHKRSGWRTYILAKITTQVNETTYGDEPRLEEHDIWMRESDCHRLFEFTSYFKVSGLFLFCIFFSLSFFLGRPLERALSLRGIAPSVLFGGVYW